MGKKLSQAEAERLIAMLKRMALFAIPQAGKVEYDCMGETDRDEFIVTIIRGREASSKCTFGGRTKNQNQRLVELHLNPTQRHPNPPNINGDIEYIVGTHFHIYTEEHDMRFAVPFDVQSPDLVDNCIEFMRRFNIIEPRQPLYQVEI